MYGFWAPSVSAPPNTANPTTAEMLHDFRIDVLPVNLLAGGLETFRRHQPPDAGERPAIDFRPGTALWGACGRKLLRGLGIARAARLARDLQILRLLFAVDQSQLDGCGHERLEITRRIQHVRLEVCHRTNVVLARR